MTYKEMIDLLVKYGDDLICPDEDHECNNYDCDKCAVKALEEFINEQKTGKKEN